MLEQADKEIAIARKIIKILDEEIEGEDKEGKSIYTLELAAKIMLPHHHVKISLEFF